MTKRSFYHRHGLLIIMITMFLVPFAIRGSRIAICNMRNDVKDWLPSAFPETKELDEFQKVFGGEAFVAASWDGCSGRPEDAHFRIFVDKLVPEVPPSERGAARDAAEKISQQFCDPDLGLYVAKLDSRTIAARAERIGNRLGLYSTGNYHKNWGGQNEVWLRGNGEQWYYLLPNGDLYRWLGIDSPMAGVYRRIKELFVERQLLGEQIAALGPLDGPWYYQKPSRLDADLIKSVVTGPSLLYDLTKEGGVLDGDAEAARARLEGWLFGPKHGQTCVYITLTEHGRQNLHRVLGRGIIGKPRGKLLAIADESGLNTPPRPSMIPAPFDRLFRRPAGSAGPVLHLGGPAVDNVAIDEEGQVTLLRLAGLSIAVGLAVSWISFRSVMIVATLSFVGLVCAQASLAIVGWTGGLLDAILMSMPSLIYVLALSGAVHLLNYYRDNIFEEGFPGDPTKAVRDGFSPIFLAAFTTALGLISLAPSDIVPIRRFGIFSAIGVMFTLVLIFAFLPSVLALWPPRAFAEEARLRKSNASSDRLHAFWQTIGQFTIRYHAPVMVSAIALTAVAALGLRNVESSVQLLKLFDPDSKLIQDYRWLETNLGKLVPMELVVRVPESEIKLREFDEDAGSEDRERFRLSFLERMEIGEHIRRSVDDHFGEKRGQVVGTAMLASTFVPPLPEPGGGSIRASLRNAFSRRLATFREDLQASDFFRIQDHNGELWRVSLRLGALNDVDYGQFVYSLKAAVEPVLAAYRYREEVLRAVDDARAGKGFRGAHVLLVGDPNRLAGSNSAEAKAAAPGGPPANTTPDSVKQDIIFLRTLASLLQNSAISCQVATQIANQEKSLAKFDCIVLATQDASSRAALKQPGMPTTVDASDFRFDWNQEHVTAHNKKWPVTVSYTGLVPVVYKAQRALLDSLIQSTWSAFISIALTMIVVLRSFSAGLVAMIPNLFPVVAVFGIMGHTHLQIDIGTMMTASIALGIAVDDTVHYLTWFRRAMARGLSRHDAILDAFGRCASAMTETALIAGLGLSVFSFSSFTPTKRFGILMLVILVLGVAAELIVTTALLAGPLGRIFVKKSSASPAEPSQPQSAPEPTAPHIEPPRLETHEKLLKSLQRPHKRI